MTPRSARSASGWSSRRGGRGHRTSWPPAGANLRWKQPRCRMGSSRMPCSAGCRPSSRPTNPRRSTRWLCPDNADFNRDGIVSTDELDAYAKQVLPLLSSVFPRLRHRPPRGGRSPAKGRRQQLQGECTDARPAAGGAASPSGSRGVVPAHPARRTCCAAMTAARVVRAVVRLAARSRIIWGRSIADSRRSRANL